VGEKYEVRKGGGELNIVFGQLYTPLQLTKLVSKILDFSFRGGNKKLGFII
jgi:hypothetical protein